MLILDNRKLRRPNQIILHQELRTRHIRPIANMQHRKIIIEYHMIAPLNKHP